MTVTETTAPRDPAARNILTPEGVLLPMTLASRGDRVGALVIDLTFIVILVLCISVGG